MRYLIFITLFICSSAFSQEVKTNSFRCGNKFVEYNMTMKQVLNICPKSQHPKRQETNGTSYYSQPRSKDKQRQYFSYKWHFERYGKFRVYVHFINNKVILITEDSSIRD